MRQASISSFKVAVAISSSLALLVILGCGDSTGLAKRYPVSGTVKYKGQPVEKGRIDFVPAKPGEGHSATGDIDNGSYSLTTAEKGDGALPGSYKVTVSSVELDASALAKLKEEAKGGQFRRGPESAKIEKGAVKSILPSKFSLPDTSGLTATVEAKSKTINFDLPD